MRTGPKTYLTTDMWVTYTRTLLNANPEWWGIYKSNIKNYHLYRKYTDAKGKLIVVEVFNYKKFRDIIEEFFIRAQKRIINGECIDMTCGIGKIVARRVERDHRKKMVNYAKTKKQPLIWSDAKQRMVRERIIYFTEDSWCRIGWHKQGKITNETVYEFKAADDAKAGNTFKQQFAKALSSDPLLKFKYIFYPLIHRQ